jgi:hypothetical protein
LASVAAVMWLQDLQCRDTVKYGHMSPVELWMEN